MQVFDNVLNLLLIVDMRSSDFHVTPLELSFLTVSSTLSADVTRAQLSLLFNNSTRSLDDDDVVSVSVKADKGKIPIITLHSNLNNEP